MAPENRQQNLSYVGAKEIALIFLVMIVLAGTATGVALFA